METDPKLQLRAGTLDATDVSGPITGVGDPTAAEGQTHDPERAKDPQDSFPEDTDLQCFTVRPARTGPHENALYVPGDQIAAASCIGQARHVRPGRGTGLALMALNAFFVTLFLGMLCARFRDIAPIVGSVIQLAFFVSPVLWKPELLGDHAVWLPLNPFYVLMETVRGPLVEGGVAGLIWLSAFLYTLLCGAVAVAFFIRFRGRLAFWV
jgi:hypothetical protein